MTCGVMVPRVLELLTSGHFCQHLKESREREQRRSTGRHEWGYAEIWRYHLIQRIPGMRQQRRNANPQGATPVLQTRVITRARQTTHINVLPKLRAKRLTGDSRRGSVTFSSPPSCAWRLLLRAGQTSDRKGSSACRVIFPSSTTASPFLFLPRLRSMAWSSSPRSQLGRQTSHVCTRAAQGDNKDLAVDFFIPVSLLGLFCFAFSLSSL